MISDDLAGLFGAGPAGPAPDSSLRQGLLTSFDSATGNNTVQVGTTTLTNVPLLLTGSETGLVAGQNVILMQLGNTFCIMGRIASPGSGSFASASIATISGATGSAGFALPGSGSFSTPINTLLLSVPSWANRASIVASFTATVCQNNSTYQHAYMQSALTVNGNSSNVFLSSTVDNAGSSGAPGFISITHENAGSVTPGGTVNMHASLTDVGISWGAANPINRTSLVAVAIFTKS